MKKYRSLFIAAICFLVVPTVFAQGPPPPPPVGVPFDGGIIAFLALALVGGARFLGNKK